MTRDEIEIPRFDRFDDTPARVRRIGGGHIGGKAHGLVQAERLLAARAPLPRTTVGVPPCVILATDIFDAFVAENGLLDGLAREGPDDAAIALAFQRAALPAAYLGDIRALVAHMRGPLAVRSSSLLEDALAHPFAGVYGTKMLPNNQPSADLRFLRLVEAVKFVYATTFFDAARRYRAALALPPFAEKMAVIVQAVHGGAYGERFYPQLSGVARSYNFYPFAPAAPDDGVVSLALGLGKTIVDGGHAYTYCPRFPQAPPPFGAPRDLLAASQNRFWAVNLGKPTAHDPIAEAEFLRQDDIGAAEADGSLAPLVSTYDAAADRFVPGTYRPGPRVLNFSPALDDDDEIPLNRTVAGLLADFAAAQGEPVEIEFAADIAVGRLDFAFLQVRPMAVSRSPVDLDAGDAGESLIAPTRALGNGVRDDLTDIVYVKPESFDVRHTRAIAAEVARLNAALTAAGRRYLLIGFGRWGSSDPWLGVPVDWSAIAGAAVIVEAGFAALQPDFSQGSHFFHNLAAFGVSYFFVPQGCQDGIAWEWLANAPEVAATPFVRHVTAPRPLTVKVDGRAGQGVVLR
jgi:hypothetical protein